jgi:nitrite reductase/ring-hydroxylating ferredoxin subunit
VKNLIMSARELELDPLLVALVGAPWSRLHYQRRVAFLVARYELMIDWSRASDPSNQARLTMQLLMEHPSAHLEHGSLSHTEISRRLEAARIELSNLRAAAPLPAPIDRVERSRVLALADVEWWMREMLHIRRVSRRWPPEMLAERYRSALREDPLPELSADLVRAIAMIPRGKVLRTCAKLASSRHGVDDLRRRIAPLFERPAGLGPRVHVCRESEIEEGRSCAVEAFGRTIAVFRDRGRLCAIDDHCPHRGGPLNLGDVENGAVICPLHGWAFDLESGTMRGNPRIVVPTYDVEVEAGDVYVCPAKRRPE